MAEPSSSYREPWRRRLGWVRGRLRSLLPFASGVLAALAAIWLYTLVVPAQHQLTAREVNDTIASAMASATAPPAYSERVYQVIQPSLVLIQTQTNGADGRVQSGLGSGVVVNQNGDILTSLHVVANVTSLQLTFADGSQSSGRVINTQPQNDIAVLVADQPPAQLVPATLGNPNALRVGDEAYVVGNPLGLYSSMSAGVISGFNRSFTPPNTGQQIKGLIQIDAAVNPGNSGGPLLNRAGEVVGIVAALVNPTEQNVFIGIGLAVPITTAGGAAGLPLD